MSRVKTGKYFIIETKINPDLVLEVNKNGDENRVKVSSKIQDWIGNNEHQLWFYDYDSKALVNKKYNIFLDFVENTVVVHGSKHSRCEWFLLDGGYIKAEKSSLVLEFKGSECSMQTKSENNILQLWKIESQPSLFFYIKLRSNPDLVVDVKGDDKDAGAKVILYEGKGNMADNQLWYEDEQGFIRSKINDFVMDLTDKKEVVVNPYSNQEKQQWILSGNLIRNAKDHNLILQMKPGNVFLNHRLVASYNSNENSYWEIELIPHQSITLAHKGKGRNFVMRSMMTGLTLEIKNEIIDMGNEVILGAYCEDPSRVTRQHFYQDKLTGVIRSVLMNFVLEASANGGMKLSPYDPYNKMQMWFIDVNKIRNRHDTNLVLQADVANKTVKVAKDVESADQLWEFCFMPAKCFHIVSLSCQKVLDVRGARASSGAPVILYTKNVPASDNQLWYEDEAGLVRSKLNGYVLDSTENEIRVMPYDPGNKEQHWVITGDRIQNKYEAKMVIDVSGEFKLNGTSIIKYKFHGGENQRWKFEYV